MTIAKTKAAGWSTNEKLTAAQISAIDTNVTNSLDRRTGQTDTLLSVVTVNSTGQIKAAAANAIQANAASSIVVNAVGGLVGASAFAIKPGVAQGILSDVASGIQSSVASGIYSSVASGITTTVPAGISPGVSQGITSSISGGIYTATANGIIGAGTNSITSLAAGGAINLAGGANDWINFATARTKVRVASAGKSITAQTGFTFSYGNFALVSTGIQSTGIFAPMNLHNGATLTSVIMNFTTGNDWTTLPTTWHSIQVFRQNTATNVIDSLCSFTLYPSEVLAVLNNGAMKSLTATCTTNNVIDTTTYTYLVQVIDSNGGAATSGIKNNWYSIKETYGSITNNQFP